MADIEKVIKGLGYCSEGNCLGNDCPYKKYQATEWCRSVLEKDAIELLKKLKEDNVRLDRENQKLIEQMAQQPQDDAEVRNES